MIELVIVLAIVAGIGFVVLNPKYPDNVIKWVAKKFKK